MTLTNCIFSVLKCFILSLLGFWILLKLCLELNIDEVSAFVICCPATMIFYGVLVLQEVWK